MPKRCRVTLTALLSYAQLKKGIISNNILWVLAYQLNTINTDLTRLKLGHKAHFRLIDKIRKVHMKNVYYKEIQTTVFFLICHGKNCNLL